MKYASVFSKNKLVAFNRLSVLAGLAILLVFAILMQYMVKKDSITEGMQDIHLLVNKALGLGTKHINANYKRKFSPPPSHKALCKGEHSNSENYKKWMRSRVDGSFAPPPRPHCPKGCKFNSGRDAGRGWLCDTHSLDDGLVRSSCRINTDCEWCEYCGNS